MATQKIALRTIFVRAHSLVSTPSLLLDSRPLDKMKYRHAPLHKSQNVTPDSIERDNALMRRLRFYVGAHEELLSLVHPFPILKFCASLHCESRFLGCFALSQGLPLRAKQIGVPKQ